MSDSLIYALASILLLVQHILVVVSDPIRIAWIWSSIHQRGLTLLSGLHKTRLLEYRILSLTSRYTVHAM